LVAGALSLVALLVMPALAQAHPLGNFTINHYAGVRIEEDRILLDVVIDHAEIPAFQARLVLDLDGDGEMSAAEMDAGRVATCTELVRSLELGVDGVAQSVALTAAGLTFPAGAGGLSTMRSTCAFVAQLTPGLNAPARVTFSDRSYSARLGWREIVTSGSGVTVASASGELRTTSPSSRLTNYPPELLAGALADLQIDVLVTLGGPQLPPLAIPDALPLPGSIGLAAIEAEAPATAGGDTGGSEAAPGTSAAVPGGVGVGELPAIFRTADLTPLVLLASILTAAALGAGHALTPGHGKTLMAAYLVGTRGTPVHAAGLGLSVALSHTLGILALAALVVGAQGLLPADVVVRTAPIIAAISIVAVGGWMLLGEARRRWNASAMDRAHHRTDAHEHEHGNGHDHEHVTHGHEHEVGHAAHEHGHATPEHATPEHATHEHEHEHEHSHGGIRHSHLPPAGSTISWRSLFVLGLAGGLIPSASALLILLGSIAAGRPAFGFVLIVAFGLGMALVMGGIGLALVVARGRFDRLGATTWLGRASGYLPLAASFVVVGFGLHLTIQAIAGNATF
jgi:ABC-type nickel/cobalt efflux system permease component RcnA